MSPRRRRSLVTLVSLLLTLPVLAVLTSWAVLRGSLPKLDGSVHVPGLSSPVFVDRDNLGTVILRADNRSELSFALGYVHAQERFFEMDLLRRRAAGELAELFGEFAVATDRSARLHRFRYRASGYLDALDPESRAQLERYTEGVNAGLDDLHVRAFPYLLLRQRPRPWSAVDSLLAPLAMYFDLQGGGNERELGLERMYSVLSPAVFDFLTASGTPWDAPLQGGAITDPPFPAARDIDLRNTDIGSPPEGSVVVSHAGSNQFAVAAARSVHGGAMLANDMHLGLRVPSLWFRAQLRYPGSDGNERVVTGVTLPGTPFMVVGSNGRIAWGFTNSYGDWLDFVHLRVDPDDTDRYRSDGSWKTISHALETIKVRGGPDQSVRVRETVFGPVIADNAAGEPLALAWTAHHVQGVNTALGELESADTIEQALAIAHRTGMPAQNLMLAADDGRIAWTLMGPIPLRDSQDPRLPADWSRRGSGWNGWLAPEEYPSIIDPADGQLWTANARVLGGPAQRLIGDGGYALGARAAQIRDGLSALPQHTEADLLALQLDHRALFLTPWYELLQKLLAEHSDPNLAPLTEALADWDGLASADSRAYRWVRAYRDRVHRRFLMLFEAPMRASDPEWRWPKLAQLEGVVWKTIQEQPPHLLPRNYPSWNAWLLAAAQDVASGMPESGSDDDGTWGVKNTSAIRHPLSSSVPALSWLLDMPAQRLDGDQFLPRVQGPRFGASQRLVVSPGREETGILHMPGGQSGHPLSPFYGAGHQDWVLGTPSAFLPGAVVHRLQLLPPREQ